MPTRGGAAGKAGDQYESLWIVEAALRIIRGQAEQVVYESLDPEASRGVEFNLTTASGEVEFWSLKRQTTTASGWTLSTLTRRDEQGRSILGDLIEHVERENRNLAVFASTLGAANLSELCSVADTPDALAQRLNQSRELKVEFEKYLLPLFNSNTEHARNFLTRLRVRTADDTFLRVQVESIISLLFYGASSGSVDASAVRRLLAEYMLDHMHSQIDRTMLLAFLAQNGYRRKDWKIDNKVWEKVSELCESYSKPLREQLIAGGLQTLPGAEKVLGGNGLLTAHRVLLSGGAGGGKSSELAHIVDRLRTANVTVLPIRLDQIDESVLTPERLGEALSLPASPVAVVAGLADGDNGVLVIDQLDAVSLASGRRTEVWSLFEKLLVEARNYPNIQIIVACREFDLEHDHRMRSLKANSSDFVTVSLGSFEPKQVDEILGDRRVHPRLKPLLVVPLQLAMFLSLRSQDSERPETRDELFEAFWREKQRRTSKRLDRACRFVEVVDQLAGWLSERQDLSAPTHVLDGLQEDADALTSEHVLVLVDNRYRFFHETFFDYAFARQFARANGRLVQLLLSGEQHLFRRAQVRQVLSFLRSSDPTKYIIELRSVLMSKQIRFHIKRVVLQQLLSTNKPTQQEWQVLKTLEQAEPELRGQVYAVIAGHPGWFDVLDACGYFDSGLSSCQTSREEYVISLLAQREILRQRSGRVADLLSKYRRKDEAWKKYLQYVCRNGDVFYGRELFDLFLSLILDGTLDGTRPGFAINDNWWSGLYLMAKEAPELASETISTWFDRKVDIWSKIKDSQKDDTAKSGQLLRTCFEADGSGHEVISSAAKSPIPFVELMLPRLASLVAQEAKPYRDYLDIDPLWSCRSFGDQWHSAHTSIFTELALALEVLARSSPNELDRLLKPYLGHPYDTIGYLVLRAWTAAPDTYAEQLAKYLAADPRRMKIGYTSWGGGCGGAGVPANYRSIEAVRSSSTHCSAAALGFLEAAIINLTDDWESRHPQSRGLRQLQLLAAMDQGRLGPAGRTKLAELRAKFPDVTHEAPEPIEMHSVGSPIAPDAQEKMNDAQWLLAMKSYAGVDHRSKFDFKKGGEHELAQALQVRTKSDPRRFIDLAAKMPDDSPASYFDAIIQGVTESGIPVDSNSDEHGLSLTAVVKLVERVHALPGRPCGRWIAYLIEKWKKQEWPSSVIDAVAWYAINDPDPREELWRTPASGGEPYYGGDPYFAGLNSTRGATAGAIATLLFDDYVRADALLGAVEHLAHDKSVAVRSHALRALLALLNVHSDVSIRWFLECVSVDPILLVTPLVERFLYFAGHRDYTAIRPIIHQMMSGSQEEAAKTAAGVCCLLALDVKEAEKDAEKVRNGSVLLRKAAAKFYGNNVSNKEVGVRCRAFLLPFFADPDESVRAKAASSFQHFGELDTIEQSKLLAAFLETKSSAATLGPLIRAVEDSPVRLPDLVCRLIESVIAAFKTDGGDVRKNMFGVAYVLPKVVMRLYTQSEDDTIRQRCLDAIDYMEQTGFFGLDEELRRQDR